MSFSGEQQNRLACAQRGDESAFAELTDPYRRELQLHCYRILGSFQDAEDMLQETLLAAWRGLERFEGRSSLRTWLYTIATNRSLNALREGARRPQLAGFPAGGAGLLSESFAEIAWLEPYPDRLIEGIADLAPGPEAIYEAKETVALAFVSGLQHLAPQQRAVLVLRDVLGFHADEVAEMLGSSPAAVNSALQRARGALERRVPAAARERLSVPRSGAEDTLITRFAEAFENDDIEAVVAMLTEDAVVSMPPEPEWHQGRAAIEQFLRDRQLAREGAWRFVPTGANGQPAFGYYLEQPDGWQLSGMFVVGVRDGGVASITRFPETGFLSRFGLPERLDA
jgi:RNA polymerase sigma-70 factor (ECF subfamily)